MGRLFFISGIDLAIAQSMKKGLELWGMANTITMKKRVSM